MDNVKREGCQCKNQQKC